jgi:hypothetical protein
LPGGKELPILVAQGGPLNGQRWVVTDAVILGREGNCDIVIPDRRVSRRHAQVSIDPGGVRLEDLNSKNGTHFNGLNIHESIYLKDGDVFQIALAQQFIYISADATLPLEDDDLAVYSQPGGKLHLDKRSRRVWIGDQEVVPPLSVAQFRLLEMLYDRTGRVVQRSELIMEIWAEEEALEVTNQALDALVRRLRDRLAAIDPTHPYITTIRGHGLRLDNPKT